MNLVEKITKEVMYLLNHYEYELFELQFIINTLQPDNKTYDVFVEFSAGGELQEFDNVYSEKYYSNLEKFLKEIQKELK